MITNFTYTKVNALLNKEEIDKVSKKFKQIWEIKDNEHKSPHKTVRVFTKKDVLKEPLFSSLLNKIQKEYELITGKSDLNLEKLWLVSSEPDDTNKAILPNIPHIDKNRFLKAMIYIHEVSANHGPIHIGKVKKNINTEEIRKKFDNDWKVKGSNTINDELLDGSLTPITGSAGDVVFFDTNTPHKAGLIKDGYSRKVLRFDFERPFFNPKPSKFSQFINRVYSKILRETKKFSKFLK